MASNITFNGVTYSIPAEGDEQWGPDLTNYFISIASNALQKTGGTFTLTAEAAFGATYGLKAPYFKSYAANPAAAGAVRLGNTESISWRNNANGADLALTSNASDALLFNSKNVLFSALGLIVNADINAAAAIAYSKLAALTVSRLLVSDGSGFVSVSAVTATEAGYLAGVTSAIQTQLNLLAPKASPTFSGTITTPLTASRLLVLGASSELAVSVVTAAEAAYLSGVTSAIQTQLDAKQLRSTLTTKGDMYLATASNVVARQAVGSDDQSFVADSSQTNGVAYHTELDGNYVKNLSVTASVAASAMTIALKTAAGNNASATDPVKIGFRSATLGSGVVSLVKCTAALSTVISSGSTAGQTNAVAGIIYVYAINNAGTIELAWSAAIYPEDVLVTTTAEGGAGAADSGSVIYSTTARTNVALRMIGKLVNTQATAGTWATAPSQITSGIRSQLLPADVNTRATNNVATTIATSGDTLIPYLVSNGNFYDNPGGWSSSIYTVPISGKYRINAKIRLTDSQAFTVQDYIGLYAKIDNTTYYAVGSFFAQVTQTQNTGAVIGGAVTLNLTAGQTIRIVANAILTATKTTIVTQPGYNSCEIERVGS